MIQIIGSVDNRGKKAVMDNGVLIQLGCEDCGEQVTTLIIEKRVVQ